VTVRHPYVALRLAEVEAVLDAYSLDALTHGLPRADDIDAALADVRERLDAVASAFAESEEDDPAQCPLDDALGAAVHAHWWRVGGHLDTMSLAEVAHSVSCEVAYNLRPTPLTVETAPAWELAALDAWRSWCARRAL
jgi:hypothetical protein